jgi:hypothetical protein
MVVMTLNSLRAKDFELKNIAMNTEINDDIDHE